MVKFSKLAAIGTIVISIIALLAISIYGTYRIMTIVNTDSIIEMQLGYLINLGTPFYLTFVHSEADLRALKSDSKSIQKINQFQTSN